METETAVSYRAAVPGAPVVTRSGKEIGTLEHVLEVPDLDLFDGIVVATDWGLRFIDAGRVALITITSIRSTLDDAEADRLPASDAAAASRVSAMDEIGPWRHERLDLLLRRPTPDAV